MRFAQPDKDTRLGLLLDLTRSGQINDLPAVTLDLLGQALSSSEATEAAVELLRKAQVRHPEDVSINSHLAAALEKCGERDEAIRFGTVEWRFDLSSTDFSHSLAAAGRLDEAIAVSLDHIRRPIQGGDDSNEHLICVHRWLERSGRKEAAERLYASAEYQKTDGPKDAEQIKKIIAEIESSRQATGNDGPGMSEDTPVDRMRISNSLLERGEDAAVGLEVIELDQKEASTHTRLGNLLRSRGWIDEAIAAYRTAIRIDPHYYDAHFNLGEVLLSQSELAEDISERARALKNDAKASFRSAFRCRPAFAQGHFELGNLYFDQGRYDDAIDAYRETVRIKPSFVEAHFNLGNSFYYGGSAFEAIAAYREAIKHKPDYAEAHNNLGTVLDDQGDRDSAIAAYREAIRLKPDLAEAHCNLGLLLRERGESGEASAAFRRGLELGSKQTDWDQPSVFRVRQLVMADRLPAILKGDDRPKDNSERLALAACCYRKAFHSASVRFYAEAFANDSKLADDLSSSNRYNAACSAALAGFGMGKDDPRPTIAREQPSATRHYDGSMPISRPGQIVSRATSQKSVRRLQDNSATGNPTAILRAAAPGAYSRNSVMTSGGRGSHCGAKSTPS